MRAPLPLELAQKLSFIVAAALVVGCLFVMMGCRQADHNDVERARDLPRLQYSQLSTENSHPFNRGREYHIIPETTESIKRFPTTRDCLIAQEKSSADPDLRLIDWEQITRAEELSVCLWRIFSSFDDPKLIFDWMYFHGAKIYPGISGRLMAKDIGHELALEDIRKGSEFRGGETFPPFIIDGVPAIDTSFRWSEIVDVRFNHDRTKISDRLLFTSFIMILSFEQSDKSFMRIGCIWGGIK